ncbi:MAG: hypothetical protein IPK87_08300 [Planctomycetes bacterium]|nr:hypothetical protein [Planctomycetota bacterium]
MNKLILSLLVCATAAYAQEVPEFANDDAFAAAVDWRRIGGPAPAGATRIAAENLWCASWGAMDDAITCWSPTSAESLSLKLTTTFDVEITRDGRWVAGLGIGDCKLWHITHAPKLQATQVLEFSDIQTMELSPDGSLFLICTSDLVWKTYRLEAGQAKEVTAKAPAEHVYLRYGGSPSTVLATLGKDRHELWRLQDGSWQTVRGLNADLKFPRLIGPELAYIIKLDGDTWLPVLHWVVDGKLSEPLKFGHAGTWFQASSATTLMICQADDSVCLYEIDSAGRTARLKTMKTAPTGSQFVTCLAKDVYSVAPGGFFQWTSGNTDLKARIGGDTVLWQEWTGVPDPKQRPSVEWKAKFHAARLDATEITVAVTATNTGDRPEPQLVCDVEFDGALVCPARIYFGTVAAGAAATRSVRIPFQAEGGKRAAHIRLVPRQCAKRAWMALTWQYLPCAARNAEELDELARKIHAESHRVLSEITGRKIESTLKLLPPQFLGFTAGTGFGTGPEVGYMNLWRCTDGAQLQMLELMGVDDLDEGFRNMEALTWSYLCHEAVHIARANQFAAWDEEYVANMIQPWLLRRVMETLKAPFTAHQVEHQLEIIATRYRASLPASKVTPVDAFVARDGTGECFDIGPWEMFLEDTGAYIYFGARINAHSIALDTSLEKLCEKYLKQPAKRED